MSFIILSKDTLYSYIFVFKVFLSVALFNNIRAVFTRFVVMIQILADARVSVKRIEVNGIYTIVEDVI